MKIFLSQPQIDTMKELGKTKGGRGVYMTQTPTPTARMFIFLNNQINGRTPLKAVFTKLAEAGGISLPLVQILGNGKDAIAQVSIGSCAAPNAPDTLYDYITVTLKNEADWGGPLGKTLEKLAMQIGLSLEAGKPLVSELLLKKQPKLSDLVDEIMAKGEKDHGIAEIKGVLELYSGLVSADGGQIEFGAFDRKTGELSLRFNGGCRTCPISSSTKEKLHQQFVDYGDALDYRVTSIRILPPKL